MILFQEEKICLERKRGKRSSQKGCPDQSICPRHEVKSFRHVVFALNLKLRDPESSFDSSPALSPSKVQTRDLVSKEKNQRDARSDVNHINCCFVFLLTFPLPGLKRTFVKVHGGGKENKNNIVQNISSHVIVNSYYPTLGSCCTGPP